MKKIEMLKQAQEKLYDVIELIRAAVADTDDEHAAESYIIAHLENWKEGYNRFDSTAIPRLIENAEGRL